MKKVFVKTKNVKNFSGAINNLIDKSSATPKMGLIYGAPGLGKSHTAIWWATKNNSLKLKYSFLHPMFFKVFHLFHYFIKHFRAVLWRVSIFN